MTKILIALMFLGLIVNLVIFWFKKEDMNPLQMIYILSAQLFVFVIIAFIAAYYLYNQGII